MNNSGTAKRLLFEVGLTQAVLSALVGRNPASISLWLRGAYRFTPPVEHEILWTLEQVKSLVRSLPFPMDLRDAGAVRRALENFRSTTLLQAANWERVNK